MNNNEHTKHQTHCHHCGKVLRTPLAEASEEWDYMPTCIKNLPVDCDCPEAMESRRREEEEKAAYRAKKREQAERYHCENTRRKSGMPEGFRRRMFATYVPENESQARAKAAATVYAGRAMRYDFPEGRPSLYIGGHKGTGKTHLAAAIANVLLDGGKEVVWTTHIDMMDTIQRSYNPKSNTSADNAAARYIYANVLVIDDLGKQTSSEWNEKMLHKIINARYEGERPTIITSNYGTEGLTARLTHGDSDHTSAPTVSRIREMCGFITITGSDYRRPELAPTEAV